MVTEKTLNEVCKMNLSKENFSDESKVYVEDKTAEEIFLKRDGRLNRLRYFKRILAVYLIMFLILIPVGAIFGDDWGNLSSFGELLVTGINLVALFPLYCLDVRRLHDMDKDETLAKISFGLGAIGAFVASNDPFDLSPTEMIVYLVETVIGLYMLFSPGTEGENKYGADPLK